MVFAFLSVWPDTAQDLMRGNMKGVRTLLTLKIKFLGYLKNTWRQEWEGDSKQRLSQQTVLQNGWQKRQNAFIFSQKRPSVSHLYTSLNRFMHRQGCGRQSSQNRLQRLSLFHLHSCHVSVHAFSSLKWSWSVEWDLATELPSKQSNFKSH